MEDETWNIRVGEEEAWNMNTCGEDAWNVHTCGGGGMEHTHVWSMGHGIQTHDG